MGKKQKPEPAEELSGLGKVIDTLAAFLDVAERVVRADKRGFKLPRGLAVAAKTALKKAEI